MHINQAKKDLDEEFSFLTQGLMHQVRVHLVKNGMSQEAVDKLKDDELLKQSLSDDKAQRQLEEFAVRLEDFAKEYKEKFENEKKKYTDGDDLSPGVLKIVKV